MATFVIEGGRPLQGRVAVSGAKNAALKMIAATVLATKPCVLRNVPRISDVDVMIKLVEDLGIKSRWRDDHTLELDPTAIRPGRLGQKLVRKLRASVVLIGPMVARFGKVSLSFPGGDQIGRRPITTHLEGLKHLGIKVDKKNDHFEFSTTGLQGAAIKLRERSVTATENMLMAAVLAKGKTTITNAASEPEIANLVTFLKAMGAKISWAQGTIKITGVQALTGANINVIPDRIEAGTLLLAGAITGGDVTLANVNPTLLDNVMHVFPLRPLTVKTQPYPGFPTDLQSPLAAALTQAKGTSRIIETLFENRFHYVDQLNGMGARMKVLDAKTLEITGPTPLRGTTMKTHDIRAGAALVLAALAAKGKSTIENIEVIDRGYERIDEKLQKLGAKIQRF